jgi:hypothetical protein
MPAYLSRDSAIDLLVCQARAKIAFVQKLYLRKKMADGVNSDFYEKSTGFRHSRSDELRGKFH